MDTIRVLLIDSTDAVKALLDNQLTQSDSLKFDVTLVPPKTVETNSVARKNLWDVILFGDSTPLGNVSQLTKLFRSRGYSVPILMLTNQSEARVPKQLLKSGIDDMLNISEMKTPLFSWTFMSTLKHAEVRKKAEEFDTIRGRLHAVNESLAHITHEINNPLAIIKLALYHLEKQNLPDEKKATYIKLLLDNIGRVDEQMNELKEVRRRLGEDTSMLAKILSAKQLQEEVQH